ncbi:phage major capsid protein [Arthrobacter burdickii]|uniref:Bacteriophage Mu GpT domain-containing protein n=1 Tax=Arthrobacter burdickii TaxID=3035920 RepID=A0ABT8K4I3_9MICC|nr:hypothetical protein [Arthrobacter burdickii]MDN4611947.1 hypothetical protein [Arthrobacter burdickii]
MDTLVNEGFRKAPTHQERVFEAARLFKAGKSGADYFKQATLLEALSTSDFPVLLGQAFSKQAVTAQKDAVKEFEPLLVDITVDDFNRHKLVDLWSGDAFETVKQGEEYKGGTLSETELTHGNGKHGKSYGLTWELRRSRDFSALANFPKFLGNGSIKGQNNKVADLLVKDNGWNTALFGAVKTLAFTPENLDAAIKELAVRENHRGELVDVSDLVLVHGPALRTEVNRVLRSTELEMQVTDGSKVTKTRVQNPFSNVVTPLESRTVGQRLGSGQNTAWALVQGKSSDLPSIIRTLLSGEETVDIRVKRDQGASVGGGDLPVEAGSFNDDTIWFRGRDVYGIDPGFTTGVWASAGA